MASRDVCVLIPSTYDYVAGWQGGIKPADWIKVANELTLK